MSLFNRLFNTKPSNCPAAIEHDHNMQYIDLSSVLSDITSQSNTLAGNNNKNAYISLLGALDSLLKLGIDGDHCCYLYGIHLTLSFKNKNLVGIKTEQY